ncbi:MAG TPA: hypothetical protein EYN28_00360 [Flavobacteriales bacterium]|nr:hypothetical protein [Flavobacteriales bacterium]HHZ97711.1 hypothetical protein [Flavobacteriales bacterium]HIB77952.1 hypothetical protein [Flavobacteriales bacterium]HIN41264.1 hypothetical protein [Flavobacteriales bacterium]HIO15646.1 hypothetical protein [Flavobacteriales bacterium]
MKQLFSISTTLLVIVFLSAFNTQANAQNETIDAFSSSYTSETAQDYNEAINVLTAIYDKDSYSINLRLGWLNYLKGDLSTSQTYYSKAINLEPSSIEAHLGYAYPTAAMGNWKDVLESYLMVLEIDPNNSLTNYRTASIYHYSYGENDKALEYINKVLSNAPFDYNSNFLKASIELNLGNISEALNSITTALEASPSSIEALKIYDAVK